MESAPKPKDLTPNLIATLCGQAHVHPVNPLIFAACYTPNGKYLAMGGMDNYPAATVTVWSPDNYKTPALKLASSQPILSLAANPNNKEIAQSAWDSINLWNLETSALTTFKATEGTASISCVDYNKDGSLLLAASQEGTCQIWDLKSKTCTATFPGGNRNFWCAKWSPDNLQVACTAGDNITRFFDVRTNTLANSLDLQIPLGELAYNSTGKQVAIAAAYQLILCDSSSAQPISKYTLKGNKIPANCSVPAKINTSLIPPMANPIQFVPNHDDVLIAGTDYGDVIIADLQDDTNSIYFKSASDYEAGAWSQVAAIAISPNAKAFVAGSPIAETNVWDLEEFIKNRKAKLQPAARSCHLQ
jgi:hypothetical protein